MSYFLNDELYAAVIKELGEALIMKDHKISELQKEIKMLKGKVDKNDTLEKAD